MAYKVRLISPEQKEVLFARYEERFHFTRKSEIYGCCIKLLTDNEQLRRTWEDNFYASSENLRSHGRVIALHDPKMAEEALYKPLTRTAFVFNFDYYGYIKSVALAVAGDILEDQHNIHSVHGAALDIDGKGVALIAPSKTGKTTHSWGLLRDQTARLVTDDWFFVRLSDRKHLAFGSEKNCYVDGNIAGIWKEFAPLVDQAKLDKSERAVVNVRWIVGATAVVEMTTLHHILLLKRDKTDERTVYPMSEEEALRHLVGNDFCNPHQMVRNDRKQGIRTAFFKRLLEKTDVHMINTIPPPEETQNAIRDVLGMRAQ